MTCKTGKFYIFFDLPSSLKKKNKKKRDVKPWIVDVTDQLDPTQPNTIKYFGYFNNTDPNPTQQIYRSLTKQSVNIYSIHEPRRSKG